MSNPPVADGLVIVDKPAGLTSHDVVARLRRLAGTRKVGHAGTLDPMATGVLVVGLQRATRLLGHLMLTQKAYDATIRLGASTLTDDGEGETSAVYDTAGVTDDAIAEQVARWTGVIEQVPSAVSAIKVDGRRSYARVRSGEAVELAARTVSVDSFEVLAVRRTAGFVDVDVSLTCSSGTYVRALARDIGAGLGVGGHVTALRRTRVGPYDLTVAHTLDALEHDLVVLPIAQAADAAFSRRDVTAEAGQRLRHGIALEPSGRPGPVAVFGPDGQFLALVQDTDAAGAPAQARPVAVFAS